jgi:1-acyl-sn-glycerol-3-phosphate acyltransferase
MLYNIAIFICKNFLRLFYRVEIEGDNSLGEVGGCIVYANHTSYLDPIVMGSFIKRPIRYMAKKELFDKKLLGFIITKLGTFPVRRGEADINAIKTSLRLLKKGEILGLYPEGTRNKSGAPMDAEPGLSMIAIKAKVPVVPVAIVSNYKIFSPIRMRIGRPIYLDEFYAKKPGMEEHREISNNLMKMVMAMLEEVGRIKQ